LVTLEEQITPELEPGEPLLWCARPRPLSRLSRPVVLPVGFLLVLVVIAVSAAGVSGAQQGLTAKTVVLFVMGVVAGGMAVFVLRTVPTSGLETVYAVTDRRAIIVHDAARACVERVPLYPQSTVVLWRGRRVADALGSISFPDAAIGGGEDQHTPRFSCLEAAPDVYQLIARVRAGVGQVPQRPVAGRRI
jgi:hypothetical protein